VYPDNFQGIIYKGRFYFSNYDSPRSSVARKLQSVMNQLVTRWW